MLKTLIINNYRKQEKVSSVVSTLKMFSEYEVLNYKAVKGKLPLSDKVDAVVLTGSEARITNNEDLACYDKVADFIRNMELPLLGICFGHQLACLTFDAEVGILPSPVKDRFELVHVIDPNDLFKGFNAGQRIPLAEYHNDFVKKESLKEAKLELLADSDSCETEAVKHRSKPFYGIQFHAELIRIGEEEHKEGLRIIGNFYNILKK